MLRARRVLSPDKHISHPTKSPKVKSPKSGKSRTGQWLRKMIGMRVYPEGVHVAEDQSFDWRIRYDEEQLEKFEVEERVRWKQYRDPEDPHFVQMTQPIFARALGDDAFEVLAEKLMKPGDPLLVFDKLRYNLIEKSSWTYVRNSSDSDGIFDDEAFHIRLDKVFDSPMFSKPPPSRWYIDPRFPSLRFPASDTESDCESESGSDLTPPQSPSGSGGSELRYSFQSVSSGDFESEFKREVGHEVEHKSEDECAHEVAHGVAHEVEEEAVSGDEQYHALTTDEAVELSSINIERAQTILANIEKTKKEAHAIYQERVKERQTHPLEVPSVHLTIETHNSTVPGIEPPKAADALKPVLHAESETKDESNQNVHDRHTEKAHQAVDVARDLKQVEKAEDRKVKRRPSHVWSTALAPDQKRHSFDGIIPKKLDSKPAERRFTFPYHAEEGPERDPSKPRYRHRPCFHHGYNNKHKNKAYHTDYLLPDVAYVRPRRHSVAVNEVKSKDVSLSDITHALKMMAKPKAREDLISKLRIATAKRIEAVKGMKNESTKDQAEPAVILAGERIEAVSADTNNVVEGSSSQGHDDKRESANSSDAEQEFLDESEDDQEYFDDLHTAEAPFIGLTKVEDEQAEEAKVKVSALKSQEVDKDYDSSSIIVPGPVDGEADDGLSTATADSGPSTPSSISALTTPELILDDLTYNPWATPGEDTQITASESKSDDIDHNAVESTNSSNPDQTQVASAVSSPGNAAQTVVFPQSLFTASSSNSISSLDGNNNLFYPIPAQKSTGCVPNNEIEPFYKPIDTDFVHLSHLLAGDNNHVASLASSSNSGEIELSNTPDQEIKTDQPAGKRTFSICSWSEGPDSSQNALRKLFGYKDPNEVKVEAEPIEIVTIGPVAAKAALEYSARALSMSAMDVTSWAGQFEGSALVEQIKRGYETDRQKYTTTMGRPDHLNNVIIHKDFTLAPVFDMVNTEIALLRGSDYRRIISDNNDKADIASELSLPPAEEALRRKAHREAAEASLENMPIGEYRYFFGFLTVEDYHERNMCICFGVCECYIMCSRFPDMKCPCAKHIETNCE